MQKWELRVSGIYSITFFGSDKIYIGSSLNLCNRGNQHLTALKGGYHKNSKLQNAFNLHSENNFNFQILEIIDIGAPLPKLEKESIVLDREQEYLDTFLFANIKDDRFRQLGYNLSRTSRGSTHDYKRIGNPKLKKISVFSRDGVFIEEILGLRETERKYNTSCVWSSCQGKINGAGDFIFKYSDKLDIKFKDSRKAGKQKGIKKSHIVNPIYQYCAKSGEFIKKWRCPEDATNELGLATGAVSRVLTREFKQTNGFVFTKDKVDKVNPIKIVESFEVDVFDKDSNYLATFPNYNKASIFTGVSRDIVAKSCKSEKLTKNQFYFKYKPNQHG